LHLIAFRSVSPEVKFKPDIVIKTMLGKAIGVFFSLLVLVLAAAGSSEFEAQALNLAALRPEMYPQAANLAPQRLMDPKLAADAILESLRDTIAFLREAEVREFHGAPLVGFLVAVVFLQCVWSFFFALIFARGRALLALAVDLGRVREREGEGSEKKRPKKKKKKKNSYKTPKPPIPNLQSDPDPSSAAARSTRELRMRTLRLVAALSRRYGPLGGAVLAGRLLEDGRPVLLEAHAMAALHADRAGRRLVLRKRARGELDVREALLARARRIEARVGRSSETSSGESSSAEGSTAATDPDDDYDPTQVPRAEL
jgi:hypothetical protein